MKASDLKQGVVYPLIVYAIRNGLHHADVFHSFEKLRKAVPDVKAHAFFVMASPRGKGGKPYKTYILDGVGMDAFMCWMRRDASLKRDTSKYGAYCTVRDSDRRMLVGHFDFKNEGKTDFVAFFLRRNE